MYLILVQVTVFDWSTGFPLKFSDSSFSSSAYCTTVSVGDMIMDITRNFKGNLITTTILDLIINEIWGDSI